MFPQLVARLCKGVKLAGIVHVHVSVSVELWSEMPWCPQLPRSVSTKQHLGEDVGGGEGNMNQTPN